MALLPSATSVGGGVVIPGVGGGAGGLASAGASALLSAAGDWVATGAVWLLGQVGHVLSASTTVDLSSSWFTRHEAVMAGLAAAVIVPMACCAAIQAIYRQSASALMRTFLVYLPLALLLTGVAVELVSLALAITDALSAQMLSVSGVGPDNLLAPTSAFLLVEGSTPPFALFLGSLLVAIGTLVLWLELVVRAAATSVAVLFLPLSLAALAWPAISHWCRRLVDTLVALILSKLVIAAVLSLAAAALAAGFGVVSSPGGNSGGFSAVVTGGALLIIAAMSPFTLLRLVPAFEAGAAAHLESARHRLQSAPMNLARNGNLALEVLTQGKGQSAPVAMGALSSGESESGSPPMRTQGIAGRGDLPGEDGSPANVGNGDNGLINEGAMRPAGSVPHVPVTKSAATKRVPSHDGGDEHGDRAHQKLTPERSDDDSAD
jgi:hypothetical protein